MKDLSDIVSKRLLPAVTRPGQYIGLETNARNVDPRQAKVTFAMAFPDAYTIGISHLGSQVLYHTINDLDFAAADRTYCPMPDAEKVMREESIPLFGWESRCAVADFDIVGFSLPYELCITNVLTMLDLGNIPILSAERTESDPLVIGGDSQADSPEPYARFFDVFIAGDGEEPVTRLIETVRKTKGLKLTREETLLRIAREVSSAYVPRFYEPSGAWPAEPVPLREDVPSTFSRSCLADMDLIPRQAERYPLVPQFEGVHDRVVIEIMRGCPNACRFCQAGWVRRPVRRRSIDELVDITREAIDATGYDEISLLSLSTGDYPDLEKLIERLNAEFTGRNISISLPSLRVDRQLAILPKLTSGVRKGGLTIAAEAGSEKLRKAIGKRITEEDMIRGVSAAWEAGFGSVKIYFIAGLPGETDRDIDAILDLCLRLSETRKAFDGNRGSISASVSWFVPKPHTPAQWEAMRREDYFWSVRKRLLEGSRKTPVNFRFHRIEQSLLEALVGRGGREVGNTILEAWNLGARMDSWTEHWNWEIWQEAIAKTGIDFDRIVHTSIDLEDNLPWGHIECHANIETLREQNQKMS